MSHYRLRLDAANNGRIQKHLAGSPDAACEESAFLFCSMVKGSNGTAFSPVDIWLLPPTAFAHRSEHYLELTDETLAAIIKRAHDLEACVVEVHSHPLQNAAQFSWSDLRGFDEFVPHIRWRLKDRPYLAIVCTSQSFDSLVWDDGEMTSGTCSLEIDGTSHLPTGLTYSALKVTT